MNCEEEQQVSVSRCQHPLCSTVTPASPRAQHRMGNLGQATHPRQPGAEQRQPVTTGQPCLLSPADAAQQPRCPFPNPAAGRIRCQFSLWSHQERRAGCGAGYKHGAYLKYTLLPPPTL